MLRISTHLGGPDLRTGSCERLSGHPNAFAMGERGGVRLVFLRPYKGIALPSVGSGNLEARSGWVVTGHHCRLSNRIRVL